MDKSLFYLIIALVLLWLVLNEIYGSKLISAFIAKIVPESGEENG